MNHHLEPIPGPWDSFDGDDDQPIPRSPWWRWVALIVVLAMVVATPFAYALSRLLS